MLRRFLTTDRIPLICIASITFSICLGCERASIEQAEKINEEVVENPHHPGAKMEIDGDAVEGQLRPTRNMEVDGTNISMTNVGLTLSTGEIEYDLVFDKLTTVQVDDLASGEKAFLSNVEGGKGAFVRTLGTYRVIGEIRDDDSQVFINATGGTTLNKTMYVRHIEWLGPPVYDPDDSLLAAIYQNSAEKAIEALELGADVHGESWQRPPLHMAIRWSGPEVVSALLDYGANVNQAYYGKTPLHIVVRERASMNEDQALDILELLLRRGADVDAENRSGMTAWSLSEDCTRCRKIIEEYRAQNEEAPFNE